MSGADHRPLSSADLAAAEARAVEAEARASAAEAMIGQLKLLIEKLRRELYGRRSERKAVLIEQLALELEELQASATEDELRADGRCARDEHPAGPGLYAQGSRRASRSPSICRASRS